MPIRINCVSRNFRNDFETVPGIALPAFQAILQEQSLKFMASFSIGLLLGLRNEMADIPDLLYPQSCAEMLEQPDVVAVPFQVAKFAAPIRFHDQQVV
jgi:hypothetical protein